MARERLYQSARPVDVSHLMMLAQVNSDVVVEYLLSLINEAMGEVQGLMLQQSYVPAGEGDEASALTIHFECKGIPAEKGKRDE